MNICSHLRSKTKIVIQSNQSHVKRGYGGSYTNVRPRGSLV
ncbi:MAG: hypothetical protein WBB28_19685 [Crinalium sp.]